MTRRPQRRQGRGFTLVEVLVALFVMALIAVLAWRGVEGIERARIDSQQRLDDLLRLQTVLAQWDQDLAMLQDSQALPPVHFDGATLRLTRRHETGLQVVAWSLRGGRLYRWAGPLVTSRRELQDHWLQSQQLMGNEPGQLVVLEGLARWQLTCWRGNAWSNCQSSNDLAEGGAGAGAGVGAAPAPGGGAPGSSPGLNPALNPNANANAAQVLMPTGLRLVLGFAEGSGRVGGLTRDAFLAPM